MQNMRDRNGKDPDGIRIVDKRGSRAAHAKWAAAAVAVVMVGGIALRSAPWTSGTPHVEQAATPAASGAEETQVAHGDPASQRTARAVRPARAVAAARSVDSSSQEEADREMKNAAHDYAGASPERKKEMEKGFVKRAEEMLEAARDRGEGEGIAAFPPPGTDPIKPGFVVPKDFDLPEGYVRHHQITDDGRRLEPILMFSPDYEFMDASGNPVEIPADGIVPADMAPSGLPLRALAIPKHPYGASLD